MCAFWAEAAFASPAQLFMDTFWNHKLQVAARFLSFVVHLHTASCSVAQNSFTDSPTANLLTSEDRKTDDEDNLRQPAVLSPIEQADTVLVWPSGWLHWVWWESFRRIFTNIQLCSLEHIWTVRGQRAGGGKRPRLAALTPLLTGENEFLIEEIHHQNVLLCLLGEEKLLCV